MDLDPHILQVEPPEPDHRLLGLCRPWPLTQSARLVAYLSLLSAFSSLLGIVATLHSGALLDHGLDLLFLVAEFGCVSCLLYGLSNKKANYLKPFLFCGCVWNGALFFLFVLCVIQMFDKDRFSSQVLRSMSMIMDVSNVTDPRVGFWVSFGLMSVLGLTIVTGTYFLHVILLTYFHFIHRLDQIMNYQPEAKRLLDQEHLLHETKFEPNFK